MSTPTKFYEYVDAKADNFIHRLGEAVAIPRCAAHARALLRPIPFTG